MLSEKSVTTLKKDYLYSLYVKVMPWNKKIEDYDKITRTKMINNMVEYLNLNPHSIYLSLNEEEFEFLKLNYDKTFPFKAFETYKPDYIVENTPFKPFEGTIFFTSGEEFVHANIESLTPVFKALPKLEKDIKKTHKDEKEISYFIVGLFRSYGALTVDEVHQLINLYYVDISRDETIYALLLPYCRRHIEYLGEENFSLPGMNEEDVNEILGSHPSSFDAIYSPEDILERGKHYFVNKDNEYNNLINNDKALFYANLFFDRLLISRGMDDLDTVITSLSDNFEDKEIFKIIEEAFNTLPTFINYEAHE